MFGKKKEKPPKKKIEPFVSKYPPLELDKLTKVETIFITAQLTNVVSETNIELIVPMNVTFSKVADLINQKNNNSCKNLKLFLVDKDDASLKSLEGLMDKTIKETGVKSNTTINLYYTFEPVENPLLLAGYYN